MPETSVDATILIATSWQALKRAEYGNDTTMICDCTVVIVFAAFFIEANLNKIIEEMNKTKEMLDFFDHRPIGLQNKLAWFYNRFVEQSKATKREQLRSKIFPMLNERFPGFSRINNFRNDIAHGKIDRTCANLREAENLRNNAKKIVNNLFEIAEDAGYNIDRGITYEIAISGINNNYPDFGFYPAKNNIPPNASS